MMTSDNDLTMVVFSMLCGKLCSENKCWSHTIYSNRIILAVFNCSRSFFLYHGDFTYWSTPILVLKNPRRKICSYDEIRLTTFVQVERRSGHSLGLDCWCIGVHRVYKSFIYRELKGENSCCAIIRCRVFLTVIPTLYPLNSPLASQEEGVVFFHFRSTQVVFPDVIFAVFVYDRTAAEI